MELISNNILITVKLLVLRKAIKKVYWKRNQSKLKTIADLTLKGEFLGSNLQLNLRKTIHQYKMKLIAAISLAIATVNAVEISTTQVTDWAAYIDCANSCNTNFLMGPNLSVPCFNDCQMCCFEVLPTNDPSCQVCSIWGLLN